MKAAPTKATVFAQELELRSRARDAKSADWRASIAVLADFYEQRGQPSRAALWRELLGSLPRTRDCYVPQDVPDLQTRPHRPQAYDCRRNQMIWLLRQQGLSGRKIGILFNLSATRIEQLVALEDRRINMHSRQEQLQPTLKATERLVAAGALPGDRPTPGRVELRFELGDTPPEDWPAEHKRRK